MENSIKSGRDSKRKLSAPGEEQRNNESAPSVYLRDDHCDWGSSGMNEYTKEFDKNQ